MSSLHLKKKTQQTTETNKQQEEENILKQTNKKKKRLQGSLTRKSRILASYKERELETTGRTLY